MTLLVISPDYASHAIPMLTLASAWSAADQRVVVATGPAVAGMVAGARMEHVELVMSRGSNGGIVPVGRASGSEDRSLRRFFAATRGGMLETLRYQASARSLDLLWRPEAVARATIEVVERVRPDAILVDHLAFASTIGLRALGVTYADVVLGHPTALPVAGEVYGVPTAWPSAIHADPQGMDGLRAIARGVSRAFTDAYDEVLRAIAPAAAPVADAFAAHGDLVLYNYPEVLHDPARSASLPAHAFLGSAVRREAVPPDVAAWLASPDPRPLVVVSFGTFLSARADVLARVVAALRRVAARVALATGAADLRLLGQLPAGWLVLPVLPQVALLERASLLVTHGGNNSVTEALTFGVPLLVMPFSTDQFDGAAAVERHGVGVALDPNRATALHIAGMARELLLTPPPRAAEIGRLLRGRPGARTAFDAVRSLVAPVGDVAPARPSTPLRRGP